MRIRRAPNRALGAAPVIDSTAEDPTVGAACHAHLEIDALLACTGFAVAPDCERAFSEVGALEHGLDGTPESVCVRAIHVENRSLRPNLVAVELACTHSVDGVERYDLNLWIGHPLEGAAYLPR